MSWVQIEQTNGWLLKTNKQWGQALRLVPLWLVAWLKNLSANAVFISNKLKGN